MTDHERFEARLEARLLARAAQGDRPFDRDAIARAAVVRARSTGVAGRFRRPGGVGLWPGSRMAFVAILLLLALAGMALVAGSGLLTPSPIPAERGVFLPAGTSSVNRHDGYTATLLEDGRVLVVGGSGSETAEVWDHVAQAFTPTGSPTIRRAGHTATLLPDGRVLIVGGYHAVGDAAIWNLAVETWDPATGVFTLGPSLASEDALTVPPMLLPDGRVLIGQGPAAEVFDPVTGTLASAGPLGDTIRTVPSTHGSLVNRDGCGLTPAGTSVVLQDGRVLTVGGSGSEGHSCPSLDSAEIWDPRTDESTLTTPMPGTMRYSTATLLRDGRVLIVPPDEEQSALLFVLK